MQLHMWRNHHKKRLLLYLCCQKNEEEKVSLYVYYPPIQDIQIVRHPIHKFFRIDLKLLREIIQMKDVIFISPPRLQMEMNILSNR